ncbi:hypothetical protein [Francisella sp. 19S2-4]|uniref:hypothetical protein n=1 Tax=Francisella sp. 19S2-4 TaxID=3088361 RepID=UPI002E2EDFAC|nr:hypothetical protein [Francisella sp. 19S2-4]MED7819141.1 hypothetical protein [Francisella sp. 19S2-4]
MESNLFNFSRCLVAAVRKQIKYSENLHSLYKENFQSSYYKHRNDDQFTFRQRTCNFNEEYLGFHIVRNQIRVGRCLELSVLVCYLSSFMNSEIGDSYMTMVYTHSHTFCLAHNSKEIHQMSMNMTIAESLTELSQKSNLQQAILVDPWIYKVSKLSDILEYQDTIKTFNVERYFSGSIKKSGYSKMISENYLASLMPQNKRFLEFPMFRSIKDDFNLFYTGRKTLPDLDIDSIKFGLNQDIGRCQRLEDLKIFIKKLSEKSSFWYSSWFCDDKKGESYKKLIECIDYAQTNHVDIGNDNMRNIFVAALKLAPKIRDKNAMPGSVTKTLMGLLNYSVVGVESYKFEEIDGMSLSEIRNIIRSNGTQIDKINELKIHIHSLPGDFFYSTNDLYEQIKSFINNSKTDSNFYYYDSRIASEYRDI